TVGGLSNSGTIGMVGSSATNKANLTVNGPATNTGTVNITDFSNLAVTGAGNAYTQADGTTTVTGSGTLTGTVKVTGGTLQGTGTVVGNVNNTAGTVMGGSPGQPGTLTVNGIYSQSGSGILQSTII